MGCGVLSWLLCLALLYLAIHSGVPFGFLGFGGISAPRNLAGVKFRLIHGGLSSLPFLRGVLLGTLFGVLVVLESVVDAPIGFCTLGLLGEVVAVPLWLPRPTFVLGVDLVRF